jgi:DNA repair exonuclease SbcCD ATPase subunit
MGNIIIKQVRYKGEDYQYESPILSDGINLLVGENRTGKSTFMDMIYYCLGGRVKQFHKNYKLDSREQHQEVINDKNNYVQLHIIINEAPFILQRNLKSEPGQILVFSDEETKSLSVTRGVHNGPEGTFSDWILNKLDIDVVEVYQGGISYKIDFENLMRLIYHDQGASGIYKSLHQNTHYITDSIELRKAIFRLLMGKTYKKLYSSISELKALRKNKDVLAGRIAELDYLSRNIMKEDGYGEKNSVHLQDEIDNYYSELQRFIDGRNALKSNRPNMDESAQKGLIENKNKLQEIEIENIGLRKNILQNEREERKFIQLLEEMESEINHISKIIRTHEKLQLFNSDTCPYCLRTHDRKEDTCICGKGISEDQYERFFYKSDEYTKIIKHKQKSINTIKEAVFSYAEESKELQEAISKNEVQILLIHDKIRSDVSNLGFLDTDVKYLDNIDDKIIGIKERLSTAKQSLKMVKRLENEKRKMETLISDIDEKDSLVKILEGEAEIDLRKVISSFSEIYKDMALNAITECQSAYISNDDYMPVIDGSAYREKSSEVPKRLIYFYTMLIMSLKNQDISFPRFLLIDTPENFGIDRDNLILAMKQITRILDEMDEIPAFQIIMTTGDDRYPPEFENKTYIFDKMKRLEGERLLKRIDVSDINDLPF